MATHSSILAWKTPWTEEPGRLQYMRSKESDTTEQPNRTTLKMDEQSGFRLYFFPVCAVKA